MSTKAPIILAVDTSDLETAKAWVGATSDYVAAYKLGLEFFLNFGAAGVKAVAENSDAELFLDLKLHDIPNTVAKAASAVAHLSPRFLTVHASGGAEMVSRAVKELPNTDVTAVTILTSLSESEVTAIGYRESALGSAVNLATLAVSGGAQAIVCSPQETKAIRSAVGEKIHIITPGVRPASMVGTDDQARTMTPREAMAQGASFVVIGRPITSVWEPTGTEIKKRAREIADEINSA